MIEADAKAPAMIRRKVHFSMTMFPFLSHWRRPLINSIGWIKNQAAFCRELRATCYRIMTYTSRRPSTSLLDADNIG